MPSRIQPGFRYTFAQFCLRLLYGRHYHHISPWTLAGVGTGAALVSPDGLRILIQLRAGNIENAGKWGAFGGYLEVDAEETFAQCITRELWEESRLRLDPAQFDEPDHVHIIHNQSKLMLWKHTTVSVWFFRTVPDDLHLNLETTDEVADYRWVTLAELDAMWDRGEISGTKNDHYEALAKALVVAQQRRFPPLKLLA